MISLNKYSQSDYNRGRSSFTIVLWDLIQTWLIHASPHPCYGWRRFWYRLFGAKIGKKVLIRKSVICNYPWRLSIGNYSWIGDQVNLYCLDRIDIADNVVVSQQAYLCTGTHDHQSRTFSLITKPIKIESGAWVAIGALVMPGITVSEGALIGARAVLTKDAEPWTIYQGCPARSSGKRELKVEDGDN